MIFHFAFSVRALLCTTLLDRITGSEGLIRLPRILFRLLLSFFPSCSSIGIFWYSIGLELADWLIGAAVGRVIKKVREKTGYAERKTP